jgi:hypothetical protein
MITRKVQRKFLWFTWWTEELIPFDLPHELRLKGLI